MRLHATAIAGIVLAPAIHAFYLPGAAPRNYALGEQVDLFVNALTPMLAGTDDSKLVSVLNLFATP
jgi:transmembrane 9 superfamily protein 2/4